jgi:hypothetical protein
MSGHLNPNQRAFDFQSAETNSSNRPETGDGMFERFVKRRVEEALGDTPVVLIVGPRRAGKTTLVRNLEEAGRAYITVKASDFAGLRALSEACGARFAFGVVLYDSTDVVPFGDRLAAAPLSCLWA